jgi:hypothetical protein
MRSYSNCILFAYRLRFHYWRRCRRARRLGLPQPPELYRVKRASRVRFGLFHILIGRMTRSGKLRLVSYVPYVADKRGIELLFAGHVVWGDAAQ